MRLPKSAVISSIDTFVRRGAPALIGLSAAVAVTAASARHGELPNRIPEAAPYNVDEAKKHPPPYDQYFSGSGNPGVCGQCHKEIFAEWNGSMMSNAWRDPAWRAAFFLIARLVATDGNCDIPAPPDGTKKSHINPFANEDCTSTFDLGDGPKHTTRGSGSLLDGFCSRCHMPANYIDAVKLENVKLDPKTKLEHGLVDPGFDPTSARDTPFAYATVDALSRNSEAGKVGITCTFCHTSIETRHTPFHNYVKTGTEYTPAPGKGSRLELLPPHLREMFTPADAKSPNLGYGVGAGAYRVSPQALTHFERFGPLSNADRTKKKDEYVSQVFGQDIHVQKGDFKTSPHKGNYDVLFERAEMCATCHDVTNPLTIKNTVGRWVGGFPIERTYSEWSSSRYAERPGNKFHEPAFKRDCQTCHMQQDYGQPGTAQTLYNGGSPLAARTGKAAINGPDRPVMFSHHFIGGNTYSTRLVGANVDAQGKPHPYPELSVYSYSSADPKSPFYNAYWENAADVGPQTQHVRLAWDRLRSALEVSIEAPARVAAGSEAKLQVSVKNTGTGHNFPTGFPEGRNAWVAVRAFDLASGKELEIADSFWKRRSVGVGYLTAEDMKDDPNFPGCHWKVPAGAPDPYSYQFRAVASLGNGCPTLDLPYATALNLVVNEKGLPIDASGTPIDRDNPLGLPQFKDLDGDGDLYDDSFLVDNRLRPMPHPEANLNLDRYSVVVPKDALGPISVTTAVYYQSMEAVVAKKFMGNLADTDLDTVLEPCVLKGACDGRTPKHEPAVVEGAPPVPMEVTTRVIHIEGRKDGSAPRFSIYPEANRRNVHSDAVIKVTASEPVTGIDATTFTLTDSTGVAQPAHVAQIDDLTWALFPNQVFLGAGKTYRARLKGPICDVSGNCNADDLGWEFSVATSDQYAQGDSRPPSRPLSAPPVAVAHQSPTKRLLEAPWLIVPAVGLGFLFVLLAVSAAMRLLMRESPKVQRWR